MRGQRSGQVAVCFWSFTRQTLKRRTCYLGGGGSEDMFTLHRGRDTGLGNNPQGGMLTYVHMRVSLGHDELT